ncbi:MAG: glycosyltransferase family 2 protein [Lentisphaerota bacterium]
MVIPLWNSAKTLPACLAALAGQTLDDAEYLLVDNGSTDESPKLIRDFIAAHPHMQLHLLTVSPPNVSAARNTGAKQAQGEWIAFTDSDCVPHPEWLSRLQQATAGLPENVGALAGSIQPFPPENIIAHFTGLFTLPPVVHQQLFDRFTLTQGGFPTANLAIRKRLFEKIGGFDPTLEFAGEDLDLCSRVYSAGYKILSIPDATVQHIHRTSLRSMTLQAYKFGQSHAILLKRQKEGCILIQTPAGSLRFDSKNLRVWLDLNQADKKTLLCLMAGLAWHPLLWLIPLYLIYLAFMIHKKSRQRGQTIQIAKLIPFVLLMLLKSSALTCGRLKGSFEQGVICL